MMILHAIWSDASLHLWGERRPEPSAGPADGRTFRPPDTPRTPDQPRADHARADAADGSASRWLCFAMDDGALRRTLGDVYDSLLVSGASSGSLTLRIPHRNGQPLASNGFALPQRLSREDEAASLEPVRVPTLVFAAADAIDLLAGSPSLARDDLRLGASTLYWSRVAALVLELLAKQRFVPAIHDAGQDRYRGYWRVVVDDEDTSDRLGRLIGSMPPICRSVVAEGAPLQGSELVENFLWTTVDALVRRCLDGDELAHAIHDCGDGACPPQMYWLRSVVGADPVLGGSVEQARSIHETVRDWVGKLEPSDPARSCRTCFCLHAPPTDGEGPVPSDSSPSAEGTWRLTLHVQAISEPALTLSAAQLLDEERAAVPRILKRPFDNALEQLRKDVAVAARHFPPLAACVPASGPVECSLTLGEAYAFLRDAAPILEREGFGVWVPQWWREKRPRLRMWLNVQPIESSGEEGAGGIGIDALVSYDWRIAVGDDTLTAEEMRQLAQATESLVRVRGRWTEVQPSEVRTAMRFLNENRSGTMTVFEALRKCYAADDLETGLPVAGLSAHGWLEDLFNAADIYQTIQSLDPPVGFQGTLRPYQLRGLEWLRFLADLGLGACLADDMGLGKTIQLIALWLHERETGRSPGPTLLVVPMSLVGNWQREIERFAPSLRVMVHHGTERLSGQEFVDEVGQHDVVISTYGLAHRDLDHLGAVPWHRVALDEAQNIKNPAAKQAVAVRSLRSVHRVALTGTPVENRLSELWSIMDFLNSGYLGTAAEFRRRFAVPIERHHDGDRAQRLRHLLRPFVLRRLKSDPKVQVDLPDRMEMKVYCNLTGEQAGLYQGVVDDMLQQIDHADGMQRRGLILAALVKLKQVCNHPVHFLGDGTSMAHRSGKCDRLVQMLEEVLAEGDKALIFTQFRVMGELLKTYLQETLDREVLFLHGGTTRRGRDRLVERFQTEGDVVPLFVLSIKAGGYGLNLTAACHVFHYDRWWNPAVEDQATDRVHRIGQEKHVQVHKYVCIGTLEERIDAMLERKRNLAAHVVGSGEEWVTELSTAKLRELFALSREAVAED